MGSAPAAPRSPGSGVRPKPFRRSTGPAGRQPVGVDVLGALSSSANGAMAARAASAFGWSTSSSTLRSLLTISAPSAMRGPRVGGELSRVRRGGWATAAEAGHGGRVEGGRLAGGVAVGRRQRPGRGGQRLAARGGRGGAFGAGAAVGVLGERGRRPCAGRLSSTRRLRPVTATPGASSRRSVAPPGGRVDRARDRGRGRRAGRWWPRRPAAGSWRRATSATRYSSAWGSGVEEPAQELQHPLGRGALVERAPQAGVVDAPGPTRPPPGRPARPAGSRPRARARPAPPPSGPRPAGTGPARRVAPPPPPRPALAPRSRRATPPWPARPGPRSPSTTATPRKAAASSTALTVASRSSGPPAGSGHTIG